MRINWKVASLVFLALTTLIVGLAQQGPSKIKKPKPLPDTVEQRLAQLPIVDYSEDNETNAVRRAKNDRHNSKVSKEGFRRPKLKDDMRPVVLDLPLTDQPIPPALPVTSDVIAIATIRTAQAFLSTDRTSIYSEVTLDVEEFLKGIERITPGVDVTGERTGGAVRFASGKILKRATSGRNVPILGHRYLIFLNSIDGNNGFTIVTGYDLVNNEVFPLDGTGDRNEDEEYKPYQVYRNSSVTKLLEDVRKAITSQTGATR